MTTRCVCNRAALALLGCVLALSAVVTGAVREAHAQTSPFLVSPYYGSRNINQGYHAGHRAYDFGLAYVQVLSGEAGSIERIGWYSDDPRCHQTPDPNLAKMGQPKPSYPCTDQQWRDYC